MTFPLNEIKPNQKPGGQGNESRPWDHRPHSLIPSFPHIYLLNACYMSDIVICPGDTVVNKTERNLCPRGACALAEGENS